MFSDDARAEMARQGMKQSDLAQKLGISQASLSEQLKKNSMKEDRMRAIADALGFNIKIVWEPKSTDS